VSISPSNEHPNHARQCSLSNDDQAKPLDHIDQRFVFDFRHYDEPESDQQRWSTWLQVDPLCRGPEPRPSWLVTSQAAIDTECGVLKTGKEADVFLLRRAEPDTSGVTLAAKRYRSPEHRAFHRSATYSEGRAMARSRDERAVKRKSTFGRKVAASQWAAAEWTYLVRLCPVRQAEVRHDF
jgi:RIO kinase 1